MLNVIDGDDGSKGGFLDAGGFEEYKAITLKYRCLWMDL